MNGIPRGVEVLVKKASVDRVFRDLLLTKRAAAAETIGLALEPSEAAMINAVPAPQLETIIARTTVHPRQRAAFLGKVAAVMLVAIGASAVGAGCCLPVPVTMGVDAGKVEKRNDPKAERVQETSSEQSS